MDTAKVSESQKSFAILGDNNLLAMDYIFNQI